MMKSRLKRAFLYICRAIGLFRISRLVVRNELLILCYHGFEVDDEARFQPKLFMSGALFNRRLKAIKRHGFNVLPLDGALERMDRDELPASSVCITIDDGFHSVKSIAADQLRAFDFPATLYVTSYYVIKGTPIFRLAVRYAFWKSVHQTVRLDSLGCTSTDTVDLHDADKAVAVMWEIIRHGEENCDEGGRVKLCRQLYDLLGVDYAKIENSRMLSFANAEELRELVKKGVDIQLHTHRHTLPTDDRESAKKEVEENRNTLSRIVDSELNHFCYPSGIWNQRQFDWLEELGVKSATTCIPGFNDKTTPKMALYRVLDEENLSQIEFEAELFGFIELIRRITGKNRKPTPTAA